MNQVQEDVRIDPPGVIVDFVDDGGAYEFKRGIRERSRLRGVLMDLAEMITVSPLARGTLVLIEPELSTETIAEVWAGAERVFRPKVFGSLAMVEARFDRSGDLELICHPHDIPEVERERIKMLVRKQKEKSRPFYKTAPGNSAHEVLRVLVSRWLEVANPAITLAQMGEETGYTYKPVRQALDGLSKHLVRFGNRGVELKSFPRDAWARLFMDAESLREPIRFWSKGEMPRTPASLLKRFRKIPADAVSHVGIGGVEGARFYAHDLDLIGQPRLDLTVHCPDGQPELEFVRTLDPDLAPVGDPADPCSLMIHLLRRPRSYFQDGFADPAECLLDLQEMRLEGQAREFLRSFPATENEDF